MTEESVDLQPYDVRSPAELIAAIAEHVRLTEGSAYLALVRDVSTDQEVVRVDRLLLPAEIFDWEDARRELRRVVKSWALPGSPGIPTHSSVLVIVRPGLCVFGPNEAVWFRGDRYASHLVQLWTMEAILVTQHGWLDFMTYEAGVEPALVPLEEGSR